jgi:hypothetical protein
MKKIVVTIAAILLFTIAIAGVDVEKNVTVAFRTVFPGATHESWTKIENTNLYMVRFVQGQETLLAYFDSDGNYVAVAKSVLEKALPPSVKKSFRKINPLSAVATIEQLNIKDKIIYLVYVNERGESKAYKINEHGSIIRMRDRNVTGHL